uniref:Uncharacterized protein n=1 Tax=Anguilla anguilla TaxID=7936 RepID=A0A0E9RTR5_ANGAN
MYAWLCYPDGPLLHCYSPQSIKFKHRFALFMYFSFVESSYTLR